MNYEAPSTTANIVEREVLARIVLTRSFAHYITEQYNEYTCWLLNTYGHEAHPYGLDLLNISKNDALVIQDLYRYFFNQLSKNESSSIWTSNRGRSKL